MTVLVRPPEEVLLGFARALRAAGVAVTADRERTYLEAVAAVGLDDQPAVYFAGRATLCASPADLERYDLVYAAWFSGQRAGTKDHPRCRTSWPRPASAPPRARPARALTTPMSFVPKRADRGAPAPRRGDPEPASARGRSVCVRARRRGGRGTGGCEGALRSGPRSFVICGRAQLCWCAADSPGLLLEADVDYGA